VRVSAHVHARVISRSLDPIDLRSIQEQHLTPTFHYESLSSFGLCRRIVLELLFGTIQRTTEARVVEWLQQVIKRSRFEGAQRVLIVGRHKDDG
jgi:hypothetical protein